MFGVILHAARSVVLTHAARRWAAPLKKVIDPEVTFLLLYRIRQRVVDSAYCSQKSMELR